MSCAGAVRAEANACSAYASKAASGKSPVVKSVAVPRRPAVFKTSRKIGDVELRARSARMYPAATSGSSKSSIKVRFKTTVPPGRNRDSRIPPGKMTTRCVSVRLARFCRAASVPVASQGAPPTRPMRCNKLAPISDCFTSGSTRIVCSRKALGIQNIANAATAVIDKAAPTHLNRPGCGRARATARLSLSMAAIISASPLLISSVSSGSPSGKKTAGDPLPLRCTAASDQWAKG